MKQWRFLVAAALLLCTALLLHARNGGEIIPARKVLSSFPHDFDGWNSSDITMNADTLATLGPGDFLLRNYVDPAEQEQVGLFIAYFPSQRAGDTIHSPKNCLPGAGWAPVRADHITMNVSGRAPFVANRYLIAKDNEQQLVLYWYWAHDRAVASEYAAKFYLVTDSIRMRRSDGSLIRLVTPITPDQNMDQAQNLLTSFASKVMSRIDDYVPR
jgi:EpsI family protein